jgi:hypothetical protein
MCFYKNFIILINNNITIYMIYFKIINFFSLNLNFRIFLFFIISFAIKNGCRIIIYNILFMLNLIKIYY